MICKVLPPTTDAPVTESQITETKGYSISPQIGTQKVLNLANEYILRTF